MKFTINTFLGAWLGCVIEYSSITSLAEYYKNRDLFYRVIELLGKVSMIRRDNKEFHDESVYPMIEDLEPASTRLLMSQLQQMSIKPSKIHRNLPVQKIIDLIMDKNEGILTANGSIAVKTGKYTGRSPDDRFIVDDELTHSTVDWGKINHPIPEDKFDKLFEKMKKHLENKEIFIFDGFVGADHEHRLAVRIITDHA